MIVVQNPALLDLMSATYDAQRVARIEETLNEWGTLEFHALENGLFPAAIVDEVTGYDHVWVRDNIHVAHARQVMGQPAAAVKTVRALAQYFHRYRHRFTDILEGSADPSDPMQRPHIRFRGADLSETTQRWAHAQNDALGYFLWLFCRLAREGHFAPDGHEWDVLTLIPAYLETIGFWQDEDSGHWEETRKISASSIGAVTAGLRELDRLLTAQGDGTPCHAGPWKLTGPRLQSLISRGRDTLQSILPYECRQSDPGKLRRYDGALLFLVYPLDVVETGMAAQIVQDVLENLRGEYGIRRYIGDSYWCSDYKEKLDAKSRTNDFSDDLTSRDALLEEGSEAQWCIFDPILSAIYGRWYARSQDPAHLTAQVHHFNRALGQISPDGGVVPGRRCPESYYCARGTYVPNDITPLLWTQANLSIALRSLQHSLDPP